MIYIYTTTLINVFLISCTLYFKHFQITEKEITKETKNKNLLKKSNTYFNLNQFIKFN